VPSTIFPIRFSKELGAMSIARMPLSQDEDSNFALSPFPIVIIVFFLQRTLYYLKFKHYTQPLHNWDAQSGSQTRVTKGKKNIRFTKEVWLNKYYAYEAGGPIHRLFSHPCRKKYPSRHPPTVKKPP
jgi:hypothetical protein